MDFTQTTGEYMKYKNCCDRSCLLSHCETRNNGGCYCVCRLKDAENTCISLLEGKSYRSGVGIIYEPGRHKPLTEGEEKEKTLQQLANIRMRLKEYEIPNDQKESGKDA